VAQHTVQVVATTDHLQFFNAQFLRVAFVPLSLSGMEYGACQTYCTQNDREKLWDWPQKVINE